MKSYQRHPMKIKGWACVVSQDGLTRCASHQENGCASYVHGRGLVANAAMPPEVLDWLLRPRLRLCWDAGCVIGLGAPPDAPVEEAYALNPHNGEPSNKDNEPS